MARLVWLARCGFVFALTAAAWGGCGGKSSNGSGSAGTGGAVAGDAGTGGSISGAAGAGGIAGGGAGTGGSMGGAAGGVAGTGGSVGGAAGGDAGTSGGAGGTGGAPCAQDGAVCDFPDTTCYYEMHSPGTQNYYYGCTCNRGDGGLSRIKCCFVGNAFSPNGVLTPANQPDWWLTPSGSDWRCPMGS